MQKLLLLSENDDVDVEDIVQTPIIPHSEGLKAAETALRYFEQQGVSVIDLLFLRDEAAKCRVQYGKKAGHDEFSFFFYK
ncbi:hypothetical protein TNCV_4743921 [Trichonephila clavipes]|nr:hypothetical protein TNCV_4743921 [Trichonephila clavipes]